VSAQNKLDSFTSGELSKKLLRKLSADNARAFEHLLKMYINAWNLTGATDGSELWEIKDLDNGGFYLLPPKRAVGEVHFPNGFSLKVNSETLGLIATSYALNHMATFEPKGAADSYFEQLQDHISSMKNAENILAAIH